MVVQNGCHVHLHKTTTVVNKLIIICFSAPTTVWQRRGQSYLFSPSLTLLCRRCFNKNLFFFLRSTMKTRRWQCCFGLQWRLVGRQVASALFLPGACTNRAQVYKRRRRCWAAVLHHVIHVAFKRCTQTRIFFLLISWSYLVQDLHLKSKGWEASVVKTNLAFPLEMKWQLQFIDWQIHNYCWHALHGPWFNPLLCLLQSFKGN